MFVIRPPVEILPPTMHQANILAEQGFRVTIACCRKPDLQKAASDLHDAIKRHSLGEDFAMHRSLPRRIFEVWQFHRGARQLIRRLRPDIVIASDAEGAFAVSKVPRQCGIRLVWHFHHNPEDTSRSWSAT